MIIENQLVQFRSMGKYYDAEEQGLKCCTVREIDLTEEKHQLLATMKITQKFGTIKIHKDVSCSKITFTRQITYIEYWGKYVIICWKHPNTR